MTRPFRIEITGGNPRTLDIVVADGYITVTNVDRQELEVRRQLFGYERHLAELLTKCQESLLLLQASAVDQRRAGEETVLAFIRNGSFLHDESPPARFAREIEAAWKARGRIEADKAAAAVAAERVERLRIRKRLYREKNREQLSDYGRRWRRDHHDHILSYTRDYTDKNREMLREKARLHRARNREVIKLARGWDVSIAEARRRLEAEKAMTTP